MNMKKIGFETFWGGILGIISIAAVIAEMIFNGITPASAASAVKDISGTLIVVILLLFAVKQLIPKKAKDFKGIFKNEMEKVITKYMPLIKADEETEGRYCIASKIDSLFDNNTGSYIRLFDFDYRSKITFAVSKTLFIGRSKEEFSEQGKIISDISHKIGTSYDDVVSCSAEKDGFTISFQNELCTAEDAALAAQIVDNVILLYIAEYKK